MAAVIERHRPAAEVFDAGVDDEQADLASGAAPTPCGRPRKQHRIIVFVLDLSLADAAVQPPRFLEVELRAFDPIVGAGHLPLSPAIDREEVEEVGVQLHAERADGDIKCRISRVVVGDRPAVKSRVAPVQRIADFDVERHRLGLALVRERQGDLPEGTAILVGILADQEPGRRALLLGHRLAGGIAVDVPVRTPFAQRFDAAPLQREQVPVGFLDRGRDDPVGDRDGRGVLGDRHRGVRFGGVPALIRNKRREEDPQGAAANRRVLHGFSFVRSKLISSPPARTLAPS